MDGIEEHLCAGAQERENQIIICLIDETYGTYGTDDEEILSEKYLQELITEFHCKFEDVDIHPGASLPAFLTFLAPYAPLVACIALFFSGRKIEDNFDAWINMAKRIMDFSKRKPVVSRNGAAILAVDAILENMGPLKQLRLNAYGFFDHRFEDVVGTETIVAVDSPPVMEYLSVTDHGFDIEADGRLFRVVVRGISVEIIEDTKDPRPVKKI